MTEILYLKYQDNFRSKQYLKYQDYCKLNTNVNYTLFEKYLKRISSGPTFTTVTMKINLLKKIIQICKTEDANTVKDEIDYYKTTNSENEVGEK